MSSYGLKISLPGYDVNSALPHQCAVHTAYPCLKTKTGLDPGDETRPPGFWHFGTVTFNFVNEPTAGADTIIYTLPHQYDYFTDDGYTPSAICRARYFSTSSGTFTGMLPIEPTGTLSIWVETTPQNMYIKVRRDAGWGTMIGDALTVNYMIFADNGA